jgi:hypothetical protein
MTILLAGLKSESDPGAGRSVRNFSTAAQVVAAATATYVTGSKLAIPEGGLKVGSKIKFVLDITKTAAGTAASTYAIVFGTAGTTADTARVSFTKPAGTAAIDAGKIVIEAVVRSVSATGVVVGVFNLTHNLAATGHATIPSVNVTTVSSGFDNTAATLDPGYIGLVVTTGASDAITIQMVEAELSGV